MSREEGFWLAVTVAVFVVLFAKAMAADAPRMPWERSRWPFGD